MRLRAALGVLGGAAVVAVTEAQNRGSADGSRYFNYNSKTAGYNSPNSNTGNGGGSSKSNYYDNGGDMNSLNSLQQYSGSNQPQYYDNYGSADYIQDNYISEPPNVYSSPSVPQNPDSSPALSALALLGFLYFLNLIQDVLENNNGRSVRSVRSVDEQEEALPFDSTFEERSVDGQEEALPFDSTFEEVEYNIKNNVEYDVSEQPRARKLSFLEEFFINLPRMLGLEKMVSNRRDGRIDDPGEGMASFITSRISMISSIMSFLSDPSPTRVKRSLQDFDLVGLIAGKDGIGSWLKPLSRVARSVFMNTAEISNMDQMQPFRDIYSILFSSGESDEPSGRFKRFTDTMNVWYGGMEGKSAQPVKGAKGMIKKLTSLLGGGSVMQEVVSSDALPAFTEVVKAMDGGHPHCLQRALCRLNTHSKELPMMSRLALQLLSNNLAEISVDPHQTESNQGAIIAGRRGEDCLKMFNNCNN